MITSRGSVLVSDSQIASCKYGVDVLFDCFGTVTMNWNYSKICADQNVS